MNKKRTYFDIIFEILKVVANSNSGLRRTHIMYSVNLSYSQLDSYLDFLVGNKFLDCKNEEGYRLYSITDKGKDYIIEFEKLLKLL